METLPPRAELERAVLTRDAAYLGVFVFGVSTTGVFCVPSCPARAPRCEHLAFFSSPEDALRAGYRPCLRCRPLAPADADPSWARDLVRRIDADPERPVRTGDLRALGLHPDTVRRHFRRRHGMTFQAYARARRLATALSELRSGGSIDDAVGASGFASHSGFRSAFARLFGGPPGARRDATCVVVRVMDSPLGALVAGVSPGGICLLELTDRRMLETQLRTLSRCLASPLVPGRDERLDALEQQLLEYFDGRRARFDVPLDLPGTPFQREVWAALLRIPYGETRSYASIASEIGRPGAARAVGRANGQNRVAIVVPCHRVIHDDGSLGGYGGGLAKKERLLALERASAATFVGAALAGRRDEARACAAASSLSTL